MVIAQVTVEALKYLHIIQKRKYLLYSKVSLIQKPQFQFPVSNHPHYRCFLEIGQYIPLSFSSLSLTLGSVLHVLDALGKCSLPHEAVKHHTNGYFTCFALFISYRLKLY